MSAHQHSGQHHGQGHTHGTGHDHSHDHTGTDVDWEALATHLETNGELHLPAYRHIADRLRELLGPDHRVRRILDVGSGPGVMTCVFAEAFPHAEAVAVDGSPALLD
ncbi:SAM-dependent methyltransferase, partial [Streptomyces sp. NPDC059564]